ncbi:hypothetical protein MTR67_010050 [Solanum verrucosum]|uniref:Protein kinase domain-containing protein n=1 Tax=Solanum verrucosum TaxID=315347 RepID=A0AAF0Q8C5_SOLVR|nr:hypothetical protein MTR67_010050 [Solanum verrucosum]
MAAYLLLFLVFLSTLCSAQRNSQTLLEVQALTSFKLSIHDPLGALTDWDSSSPFAPCDWRGVFCVNGRVGELRLPHLQLSGPLSEIPGELPQSLRYFDLSSNLFSGDIPRKFSDRSQLLLINLSYNRFSGEIPASLGRLQQLQYLWLAYNNLVGTLPSAIANCSSLVHLSAEGNAIGGLIPAAIAALPKLQVISLSHNNLSGKIPSAIGNLRRLEELRMTNNSFEGALPFEITNCSDLKVLDLEGNRMTGDIPMFLGDLRSLKTLSLGRNQFSGSIPSSFRNLSNLENLNLGGNGLNGSLPEEVMALSNLSTLNLSGNKFSGSMPVDIGNLQQLSVLNLSKNGFSGTIPSSIGTLYKLTVVGLPNLQVIALQENKLSGNVPEGFSSLLGMQYLNLSSNSFSGHIPSTFGFLTSLVVLSLSNNHINGSIPPDLGNCSALIPADLGRLSHLSVLDLGRNNLTGEVPVDISNCSSLTSLVLDLNHLSGNIPESLSRLSNLTVLDLSTNNFIGEIPANLTMLSSLVSFNVSNNNLGGQIPEMLGSRFNNSLDYTGNQGLCGEPLERRCETSGDGGNKLIMFIAVAASGALLLLSCCCLYTYNFLRWRRKLKEKAAGEKKHSPARASSRTSGGRGSGENGGPKLVMFNNKITLAETIEATREFDEEHVLSRTHYGVVYKACFNDGMVLSIRRLSNGTLGENMFRKEAESLGRVKHRNLTVLRGYYAGPPNLRLLVHDYMPNGNLATLLQEASHQDGHVLNWPMRHLIALGIARGLAFLHSSSMVHGDVKPQNVLFDADFEAHLSEFGLGKLVVATPTEPSTSTSVGTLGYISPEVALTGETTRESDAYSFGIVLLELLTGKRPLMFTQDEDIVKWVKRQLQRGQISELLEPGLLELDPESSEWEEFLLGIKVGLLCTAPDPLDRPTMADIVFMLEGCRVGPDIASSADPTCQPSPA